MRTFFEKIAVLSLVGILSFVATIQIVFAGGKSSEKIVDMVDSKNGGNSIKGDGNPICIC